MSQNTSLTLLSCHLHCLSPYALQAEDEMRARHQVVGDKLASQAAQAQGARLELQQMIASSKQEMKALHESGFDMRHPACKVRLAAHCQPWDAREH